MVRSSFIVGVSVGRIEIVGKRHEFIGSLLIEVGLL